MKHAVLKRNTQDDQIGKSSKNHKIKIKNQKEIYEKPWFWICMAVFIFCITRPIQIIICGNGNGNGCDNDYLRKELLNLKKRI